ncbi:MAG: hypothetical protein NDI61_11345, partial [Bdellovibrionaceae bacterium]|nr:hypothetical protein [Pseudobdellovibrionaceae bacterium]
FKVQFTNKKGTPDELRFLGAYSKQTDGWTFSHLPTATPTDRDYFIGLRMGILKGEFEYRSAAALIEMQTLLPKLKSRAGDLRSLADVEALHRLSLALKNNSLDVRRVGRILQVFERFKASLSDPTLRRHPLTEESIAHVLQSKGLFSEKGEKLADPSPDSIGRFLKGEFGDRVYMNDGLGVAFELQRKGSGVGVKINFLTNRSATDDAIKKWADEVYSLKPIEIQRQLIDGFRRLAIVEITTHLAASETQVRLVESLVSDITSGGFSFDKNGLGMITKSEIAYDLADAVTLIQKLASNSLMQSGRDSETLSLDERIQLVQSGHDAYLAAQREKYPTSPHLGRMQLVSQQLKKFILAVFPSTPPEQIVELDARIKREFDDFLKSIEI